MDVLEHYAEIGLAFVDAANNEKDQYRLNSIDNCLSLIEFEKTKNSFVETEMKKWQQSDNPMVQIMAIVGKASFSVSHRRATNLTIKEAEFMKSNLLNQLVSGGM